MSNQSFESYFEDTVKISFQEILEIRDKLPAPIEKFHLFAVPESLYLEGLMVKSVAAEDEIPLTLTPDVDIQLYINNLTETFCEKWDIDPKEYNLEFFNPYDAPVCLYWMEMIKVVKKVVGKLKKEGVEFSESAEVGIWFDDDYWESTHSLETMLFNSLDKLPSTLSKKEMIREFFELFYAKKDSVDVLMKNIGIWEKKYHRKRTPKQY